MRRAAGHPPGREQPRCQREDAARDHGRAEAGRLGHQPGDHRPDGVAEVAPEPVHPEALRAPRRVGVVGDGGAQRGLGHRGPGAEQDRADQAGRQRPGQQEQRGGERGGLDDQPGDDHRPAPDRVGQPPGEQLAPAPQHRVQALDQPDRGQPEPVGGEQQREHRPGQPVVEVVGQPGLGHPAQRPAPPAGVLDHGPEGDLGPPRAGGCFFNREVPGGVPDHRRGQDQPGHGVDHADQLGHRPQPVGLGQVPGRQRGRAHGHVPGGFVQAHGHATATRPDQVDLHVHDHRRGKALIDAEAQVRGDDPSPGRGPGEQERDRQAGRPAGDQQVLAGVPGGQRACHQVGQRLGDAERDDEAEHRHVAGQVEHPRADQAGGGPLQADHAADEDVHHHQQRELLPVRAQPEPHPLRRRDWYRHGPIVCGGGCSDLATRTLQRAPVGCLRCARRPHRHRR